MKENTPPKNDTIVLAPSHGKDASPNIRTPLQHQSPLSMVKVIFMVLTRHMAQNIVWENKGSRHNIDSY